GEDGHRWSAPVSQLARSRDTVHAAHPDVHEDDVGLRRPGQGERLRTVGSLTHDVEAVLWTQDPPQALTHEGLVVDKEDADHVGIGRSLEATGSRHSTVHPKWTGPAERLPETSSARSRMPTMPEPPDPLGVAMFP